MTQVPGMAGRFVSRIRRDGLGEALRDAGRRLLVDEAEFLPLRRADPAGLFATDVHAIHEREKSQIRASSLLFDASQVEASYPLVFESQGRLLRHAFLPATGQSRGLVVLFHGHNAFLHFGPARPWRDFDVLAPWDTFGWRRQGSWFWGEKGDDFVAHMIAALIESRRRGDAGRPWFCMGSSMGGFGALYHGLALGCDGIYVMCPQVDLRAKINDFGGRRDENPYATLAGDDPKRVPDLVAMAETRPSLPPLYLIQNQYDHVNPFAGHGLRLVEVYNRRGAWCGLRVHPSIGHGGDGSQSEAELYFSLILDRRISSAARAQGPS